LTLDDGILNDWTLDDEILNDGVIDEFGFISKILDNKTLDESVGIFDDDDGIPIPFQVISSFPSIFSDIPHTQYLLGLFPSLELISLKERERKDEVLMYYFESFVFNESRTSRWVWSWIYYLWEEQRERRKNRDD
jgi:hypothetical protein